MGKIERTNTDLIRCNSIKKHSVDSSIETDDTYDDDVGFGYDGDSIDYSNPYR